MRYEEWLKTACFKEPTKEAKELAKMAWNAAIIEANEAIEIEYNMLGYIYTSTDMFENAQKAIAGIKAI